MLEASWYHGLPSLPETQASTPERSTVTDTTWITRESVEDPDQLEDILDIQDMLVPTALAEDGEAELRESSERQESDA